MRYPVWIALFVGLWSSPVSAQEEATPTMQEARAFSQAKDWANAVKAFAAITRQEPINGGAWLQLGISLSKIENYREAIAAYKEAEKLAFAIQITGYNMAGAYAMLGEKEKAFEWLDKAMEAGFGNAEELKDDSSLAGLHGDSRFDDLVARADKNARPCEYDPKRGNLVCVV